MHSERAGRASRELAFHGTEQALDQRSASIEPTRKWPPHFGAHSVHAPSWFPAFRGDHTLRSECAPNVGVIPLAVELGVGLEAFGLMSRVGGTSFQLLNARHRSRTIKRFAHPRRAEDYLPRGSPGTRSTRMPGTNCTFQYDCYRRIANTPRTHCLPFADSLQPHIS